MIALACGLRVRGHHVEFVAPANFVAWIRGHGFACESDGVDVEAMLRSAAVDLQSARQQMRYLRAELAPRLFDTAPRAGRDADMIVGSGMQIAAPSIADLRGVPYVGVGFRANRFASDNISLHRDLHPGWIPASWFETRGLAALLTMRVSDLILRSREAASRRMRHATDTTSHSRGP